MRQKTPTGKNSERADNHRAIRETLPDTFDIGEKSREPDGRSPSAEHRFAEKRRRLLRSA
ncbi:hypothetical protein [Thermopirellula anaerolimosa]